MFASECPHCNEPVWIEQINCGIFRHAAYRHNYEPIPPHTSESECNRLIFENKIYGCGKPFRVVVVDTEIRTEKCEYI